MKQADVVKSMKALDAQGERTVMLRHTFEFGKIAYARRAKVNAVEVELTIKDDGKGPELSLCGNIWNHQRSDVEACGQIQDTLAAYITDPKFLELRAIWDRWHLNGMRAGCPHQRAEWNTSQMLAVDGVTRSAGMTQRKEHPKGMLSEPCETCGYKYGTAWLFEELPEAVLAQIETLTGQTIQR